MGDMGDDFRAFREYKKEEKEKRGDRNRKLIHESGLQYECVEPLYESHYHVTLASGEVVSFWPTTGAWRRHASHSQTRFGWGDLMKYAEKLK